MAELLDDNSHQRLSSTSVPRVWHFYHAGMAIGLCLFITILGLGVFPLFPEFIEKSLSEILLPILIFGLYGITFYAYYKGFKWELLPAFLGATFSFFFCFILTMTYLGELKNYTKYIFVFFSTDNNFSDIVTVGLFYSIFVLPCTELMLLMKAIYQNFSKR